jgi:ATP-dependent helicase/nuclease subunit A
MVRRGLVAASDGLELDQAPYGPIEIWRDGKPKPYGAALSAVAPLDPIGVPAWLSTAADQEPEPVPPIRPSSALGAADRITRPGDGPFAPDARLRGTLIHALLERLPGVPAERWPALANAYVAARAPRFDAAKQDRIVRDTLRVLTDAALAPLFGPGSRAEAPIAGWVATGSGDVPVSGQIDRLTVLDGQVLLADFKTTARPPPPEEPAPQAYVAQLALFRALLAEIYPDRNVRAFLVWTSGPLIRELSGEELDAALRLIQAA